MDPETPLPTLLPAPSLAEPAVRYKLVVAYRGTRFHGWQFQTASSTWKGAGGLGSEMRTVQGVLIEAIGGVVNHPVNVVGSSRTDAGVHAKGQVCHFDTNALQIPAEGLRRAVNARLPGDVVIREISVADPWFDAISDAELKRYQYAVWNRETRNVFLEDLAFHRWQDIDVGPMREAGRSLEGTHDFASFARPGHGRETTVRTVTACHVSRRGGLIVIGVEGTGFLWNQVRIMAGTLIEVGLGRTRPEAIAGILAGRDRRLAGPTAPAHGLYLQWIRHRVASRA